MTFRNTCAAALIAVTGIAAGCGSSGGTQKPRVKHTAQTEYQIANEDVLEVVVWKEPGLSGTIPVRPDGRITVPGVGEMVAAGRTARQIETQIKKALEATLTSPTVSVGVKERGAKVFVLGEVGKPGAYPLLGGLNVLQALALAGGLTEFADGGEITVLRREEGKQVKYRFSYGEAVGGGYEFELEPGDTIVVP